MTAVGAGVPARYGERLPIRKRAQFGRCCFWRRRWRFICTLWPGRRLQQPVAGKAISSALAGFCGYYAFAITPPWLGMFPSGGAVLIDGLTISGQTIISAGRTVSELSP